MESGLNSPSKPSQDTRGRTASEGMNTPRNPICSVCRENETPSPRHDFCEKCAKARRSWQLKVNNEKWRERKEAGEVGHRVMYNGMPTRWAMENPVEACRIVLRDPSYDDATLKLFIRALGRY